MPVQPNTSGARVRLHVVLEKQEEGGFLVYIPELPGCHSQGETRAEALQNITEAKELYLDVLNSRPASKMPKVEVLPLPG